MQVKLQMTDDTFHINTVRRVRHLSNAQAFGDNERDDSVVLLLRDYKNNMAVRPSVEQIHKQINSKPNCVRLSSCEFITSEGYCFLFMVNKNLLMIDVATELKTLTLSYIGTHDALVSLLAVVPFKANQVDKYSVIIPCEIVGEIQSKDELFMCIYEIATVREDKVMVSKLLEQYTLKESPNAICDNIESVNKAWLKFSSELPKLAEQLEYARLDYNNARQTFGRIKALVVGCQL